LDLDILCKDCYEGDYRKLLKKYWDIFPNAEIIILTPPEKIRIALEIIKMGASDYLTYPLISADMWYVIEFEE